MATTLIGNPPASRNANRVSGGSMRARSGTTEHVGPIDDADGTAGAGALAPWAPAGMMAAPIATAIMDEAATKRRSPLTTAADTAARSRKQGCCMAGVRLGVVAMRDHG